MPFFAADSTGSASQATAGELIKVMMSMKSCPGRLTNPSIIQAQNQGSELAQPNIHNYLWTDGTREGNEPRDPKQHDLHDTGQ